MPTINNADGSVRDANWPSQDKPVMMDKLNDIARKARQDAHDAAKVARGGLKSTSRRAINFDGSYTEVNNTTGETRFVNADGTPRA